MDKTQRAEVKKMLGTLLEFIESVDPDSPVTAEVTKMEFTVEALQQWFNEQVAFLKTDTPDVSSDRVANMKSVIGQFEKGIQASPERSPVPVTMNSVFVTEPGARSPHVTTWKDQSSRTTPTPPPVGSQPTIKRAEKPFYWPADVNDK